MNAHHVRRMVMAAGFGLAAACHAQWGSQLLNNFAVTNEAGQMIVLHDGGGHYGNNPNNAPDKAFDGDVNTYYDAVLSSGAWAGFGLRTPKLITRIRYTGRTNVAYRVKGIIIQGATRPDFSDAVTLWTLAPPANWNTMAREEALLSPAVTNAFSYVRFFCTQPETYGGNFTHVEFYGADPLDGSVGAPPAPVLTFDGCINWRMNLCWIGAPGSTVTYEIQRRIAHEDGFAPLTCAYAVSGEVRFCDTTLTLYQDTDYRIRGLSNVGASPWVNARTGLARNGATGTWLGTAGTFGGGMTGDKAFDGNVTTFFDAPAANGNWTGLDFGSEKELVALRFVPRRDYQPSRMNNGWFEVADNPSFANPTVITNVTNVTPPTNVVTEMTLPQPVRARYARYCSPNNGWGNVAEVEFIQAPSVKPPQGLAVAGSDITNAYAVLTWRIHDIGSLVSSVMVYRATSPGGPYTAMTPGGVIASPGLPGWTDTTVAPCVTYYYKVSSLLDAFPAPLESDLSGYVSYTPFMRIERDWGDLTRIKPGMSLLGAGSPFSPGTDVDKMFDDDMDTFVDTKERNPAVGVNLGKPYRILFMRHAARPNSGSWDEGPTRLNGAELRGSNNPNYTGSFTHLATFAGASKNLLVTQQTVTQEAFQYIFIQRPTLSDFFGNIAELELYGWDPDAADGLGLLLAPISVGLSLLPGGVRLDWAPGTQQDTYRVERSADGVGGWVDLGDTQGAVSFTDSAPILNQRAFYRVVAVRVTGQGEEVAYSDAYSIVAYTLGNGTGLTAAYYTNFSLA